MLFRSHDHGYAHFLFTKDLSGNLERLESLIPDDATFRIELVSRSLAELRALADKVSDGMAAYQEQGLPVVMVAVSVVDNAVLVSVASEQDRWAGIVQTLGVTQD